MNLQQKHIVFILSTFGGGGAERQAALLAGYLHLNHECRVTVFALTLDENPEVIYELLPSSIKVNILYTWFSSRKYPIRLIKLARLALQLRASKPDAILAYQQESNLAISLIWRWTGTKTAVWNQRGMLDEIPRSMYFAFIRMPIYITNGTAAADALVQHLGCSSERVLTIFNGVPNTKVQVDRGHYLAQFNIPNDAFVACMVANLSHYKDHHTLLYAWQRVTEHTTTDDIPYLILAGYLGDKSNEIQITIQELSLEKSVRVIGFHENIPALYAAVNLGILSSRAEGLPNAVIECFMAERAFVGTDISGIRDVVGSEYPYLAPPGDVESLAEQIITLWKHPVLRTEIAYKNRHRALAMFDIQQQFEHYANVLIAKLQE